MERERERETDKVVQREREVSEECAEEREEQGVYLSSCVFRFGYLRRVGEWGVLAGFGGTGVLVCIVF